MQVIQNFLWIHPWWHATLVAVLVAIPSAIALYFSWRDGLTADELSSATTRIADLQDERNRLSEDANRFHDEANRLREELNTATNR